MGTIEAKVRLLENEIDFLVEEWTYVEDTISNYGQKEIYTKSLIDIELRIKQIEKEISDISKYKSMDNILSKRWTINELINRIEYSKELNDAELCAIILMLKDQKAILSNKDCGLTKEVWVHSICKAMFTYHSISKSSIKKYLNFRNEQLMQKQRDRAIYQNNSYRFQ